MKLDGRARIYTSDSSASIELWFDMDIEDDNIDFARLAEAIEEFAREKAKDF